MWLFGQSPWLPRDQYQPITDAEDIEFPTADGLTLRGSIIASRLPYCSGVVLFSHELNSDRWSVSPWVDSLSQQGYDIITFDQRNHGTSDSDRRYQSTPWISQIDVDDIRAAMRFIEQCYQNVPVTIMGVNKGGLTALGAAADCDLPIQSIVIDCDLCTPQWQPDAPGSRKSFSPISWIGRMKNALINRWRRKILGVWCGCRFVNLKRLASRVRQPVLWIGNDRPEILRRFDDAEHLEPHYRVLRFLEINRPLSQPSDIPHSMADADLKIIDAIRT